MTNGHLRVDYSVSWLLMQTLWEPLKRSKLHKPQTQKPGQFYNDITICFIFFIPLSLILWIIFNTLHSSIHNSSIDYPMVSQFLLERSRNLWLKYASCLTSQHCSGVPIMCLFSWCLKSHNFLDLQKNQNQNKKELERDSCLIRLLYTPKHCKCWVRIHCIWNGSEVSVVVFVVIVVVVGLGFLASGFALCMSQRELSH